MEVTTGKRGNPADTLSTVEPFISLSGSEPTLNKEDSKGKMLAIVHISQAMAIERPSVGF